MYTLICPRRLVNTAEACRTTPAILARVLIRAILVLNTAATAQTVCMEIHYKMATCHVLVGHHFALILL